MCRFTAVMAVNLEYSDQKTLAGTNEQAKTDFHVFSIQILLLNWFNMLRWLYSGGSQTVVCEGYHVDKGWSKLY